MLSQNVTFDCYNIAHQARSTFLKVFYLFFFGGGGAAVSFKSFLPGMWKRNILGEGCGERRRAHLLLFHCWFFFQIFTFICYLLQKSLGWVLYDKSPFWVNWRKMSTAEKGGSVFRNYFVLIVKAPQSINHPAYRGLNN